MISYELYLFFSGGFGVSEESAESENEECQRRVLKVRTRRSSQLAAPSEAKRLRHVAKQA